MSGRTFLRLIGYGEIEMAILSNRRASMALAALGAAAALVFGAPCAFAIGADAGSDEESNISIHGQLDQDNVNLIGGQEGNSNNNLVIADSIDVDNGDLSKSVPQKPASNTAALEAPAQDVAATQTPAQEAALAEAPVAGAAEPEAPAPALAAADDAAPYEESHVNMYRLYNPNSGEHFYTSSLYEAQHVASVGWQWEGIGWVAPTANERPVFRLYNPNAGDHHYTLSAYERDHLVSVGWSYEGIGWYSDSGDQVAVLREYNPNAAAGAHNFTTSPYEDSYLGRVGWSREGTAWYATDGESIAIEGFWLVTAAWGSLERYWVDSSANVAKGRLIDPAEGSGWWAYATGGGAVVRGKHDTGWGRVYVADDKGELATTPDGTDGWLVTDAYDGGLQRYRYDASSRAMVSGFFEVDGQKYFGVGGQGYVLRNGYINQSGQWYHADNDGVLTESEPPVNIVDRFDGSLYHGPKDAAHQKYIVLHDTEGGGSPENVVDWWVSNGNLVSSHFVVGTDGTIVQCVPMDQIAHHAGYGDNGHNDYYGVPEDGRDDMRGTQSIGSWMSDYGMNAWSIGIEMVHWGNNSYPEAQLNAVDNLIAYIDSYYGFQSMIIDHKDWRSGNSDTSDAFAGYLANYKNHRTHN